MTYTLEIDLADILERKYPHGFHAPADIEIGNFLEFADDDWTHELDVAELLAKDHSIGIIRDVQLVLDQRSDLTEDEAWKVLQLCQSHFEQVTDTVREIVRQVAESLFPKPSGKAGLRAVLARIGDRIEALPDDERTDPAAYGAVQAELDTADSLVKGSVIRRQS